MNSDVIKLLPDSVANQIAAGEVIQRPASVVKELVENAVDAGAKNVQVIVRDAGRTLIQVVDDGCGMSPTDARLAFERHSTSKIRQASDLFTLHTMGFRGEALASIVAVSQVDVRTMLHEAQMGTRLIISGSQVESQTPEACTPGTNMMVKNLFFNVPARRKFLKKDAVEMSNILHEFERLALVNPQVGFTLIHNDTTVHRLLPGTFKQRICELFGRVLEQQLLPVETDTSLVKISGFVSRPENCRRRGALQYFMVNGRNMRHPYFHKAVLECYQNLIGPDVQPCYFLNFEVQPDTIDVNIHPQKHEIKFENELPIRQILTAAIKETMGRFNVVPAIEFDTDDAPEIPAFRPEFLPKPAGHSPAGAAPRGDYGGNKIPSSLNDWEKLYESFARGGSANGCPPPMPMPDTDVATHATLPMQGGGDDADEPGAGGVMQFKNRYLLTSSRSGLMVIDQHRAHVRVLYERYLAAANQGALVSQAILFPEAFTLEAAQHDILGRIAPDLARLGFDLAFVGDNTWMLNGVPSVLPNGVDPTTILTELLAELAQGDDANLRQRLDSRLALQMARAGAVRAGQPLSCDEIESLIAELLRLPGPALTPDGMATLAIISPDDIARLLA